MNPEELLEQVADLLEAARPASSGIYSLFIADGKIRLGKGIYSRTFGYPLARFDSRDINEGISGPRWNRIAASIRRLKKEGIL